MSLILDRFCSLFRSGLLLSVAFIAAEEAVCWLPTCTRWMVSQGWPFLCYIGPLWRDHNLSSSEYYGVCIHFLEFVAGSVGVVAALLAKVLVGKGRNVIVVPIWALICFSFFVAVGLVWFGPADRQVSDVTYFGATLTDVFRCIGFVLRVLSCQLIGLPLGVILLLGSERLSKCPGLVPI